MRTVIIEDEPPAARKLREFILRYDKNIEISATLASIRESYVWFNNNAIPDLIFSDIELLDGNVFTVFENEEINCPVIFTTAYDQFWIQALEKSGIAYLLKPFSYEKFAAAMQKYAKLKQNFAGAQTDFWREIQANLTQPKYKERFIIKIRGNIQFIETKQIAFVQMQNEILFAFDAAGNKFPLSENLIRLEQILDPKIFFRVSRSEIVNLNFIERLEPDFHDRLIVKLRNLNVKLACSASRTPQLRKWLEG